jgi:hypothetical protein
LLIIPLRAVEARRVDQNNMVTVLLVVQNPKGSNTLGGGLKRCVAGTFSRLASEQIDDLDKEGIES